jgi:hypothetical protein
VKRRRRQADLFFADLLGVPVVDAEQVHEPRRRHRAEANLFFAELTGKSLRLPRPARVIQAEALPASEGSKPVGQATEIPVDVLSAEDGGPVVLHLDSNSPGTLRVAGRFRVGGPDGLLIAGALEVGNPDPLRRLSIAGKLALFGGDEPLQVQATFEDGHWAMSTTGSVAFGNGISLSPSAGKPILALAAAPRGGEYRFAAAGVVQLPLSGATEPADVELTGELQVQIEHGRPRVKLFSMGARLENWRLSSDLTLRTLSLRVGYDEDRITTALAAAIPIGGGFEVEILEEPPPDATEAPNASSPRGLTIRRVGGRLDFTFAGGIRLHIPAAIISNADGDGSVVAEAAGVFTFSTDQSIRPAISRLFLALRARRIRLGGSNGLLIEDAELAGANLDRFLSLGSAPHPVLMVSGRVQCPFDAPGGSVTLILRGARFVFEHRDRLPRLSFAKDGELGFESSQLGALPIQITMAKVRFKDGARALPQALAPENLIVSLGARLNLALGGPAVVGAIDELRAEIRQGRPRFTLTGASVGVNDLSFGVARFSGALGFHNLDDPRHLQLEGVLGGTVYGSGVKALVAIKFENGVPRPLGVCLDVSAGPSGITLPYGFVITGASGGISFANSNASPCDFRTYERARKPLVAGKPLSAKRPQRTRDCPGECPPPGLNILCQPHPDQVGHAGRVILKFTALEERFWATLPLPDGTTVGHRLKSLDSELRQRMSELGLPVDAKKEARRVAQVVLEAIGPAVERLLPPAGPERADPPLPAGLGSTPLALIREAPARYWSEQATTALVAALDSGLSSAPDGQVPSVYTIVRDLLYGGISCPDVTYQLSGTFSYTGVSCFLSVTGAVAVSSTGSIGIMGFLNVLSVPLGQLRAFVATTSAVGDPEPSLCGDLRCEVGPLHLGLVSFVYRCPGCVTNLVDVVRKHATALGGEVLGRAFTRMGVTASVEDALARLQPGQAGQLVAQILSDMPRMDTDVVGRARQFVAAMARDLWDGFQPEIRLCGKVAPKLFGLSVGGDLVYASGLVRKDRLEIEAGFSPLYLLGRVLPIADLFSGMDSARLAVGMTLPRVEQIVVEGLGAQLASQEDLDRFLAKGVERLLAEAAFTFSYQFFPLGMKVADGQGRVVMPYLTPHPKSRRSTWRNPDGATPRADGVSGDRGEAAEVSRIPSRREVLFAALDRGQLSNVGWNGDVGDVLPVPTTAGKLALQRDYFPHGGLIGAGKLQIPRLLWDAPPLHLLRSLAAGSDLMQRLRAGVDLIRNYVLATREAGTLAFYIPAPNPPVTLIEDAQSDARTLLDGMLDFDLEELARNKRLQSSDAYALDLAFFEGRLTGRILGLDFGAADLVFVPPSGPGGHSELRARVALSSDARLRAWIEDATLDIVVTNPAADRALAAPARKSVEQHFQALLARLETVLAQGAIQQGSAEALLGEIRRTVVERLPKVGATAKVRLHVPAGLGAFVASAASAELHAYSPGYDPESTGGGVLAAIRREGGLCVTCDLDFKLGRAWRGRARAELAIHIPDGPTVPVRLIGQAHLDSVAGHGGKFLDQELPFQDASLAFDSAPAPGRPMLSLRGVLPDLRFGAFRLAPAAPETRLRAALMARPSQGGTPGGVRVSLALPTADVRVACLSTDTPVQIRPSPGQSEVELTSAGGEVLVEAPRGMVLLSPDGRSRVLHVSGLLRGRAQIDGRARTTLSLSIPRGTTLSLLPGAGPLGRSFPIESAIDLTVSNDGSFTCTLAVPPIVLGGGQFTIDGARAGDPLRVVVTQAGVSLQSSAHIAIRLPSLPARRVRLDTFRLHADGSFAIETKADLGIPGLAHRPGGVLRLERQGQGFRLVGLSGASAPRPPSLPWRKR